MNKDQNSVGKFLQHFTWIEAKKQLLGDALYVVDALRLNLDKQLN
jgi:hypothetical protein